MTPRTVRLILLGLFLLALAATPFLGQGGERHSVMAHNAAVIRNLSVSQRDRLNQNFEDYQKLTPAEREQVNHFHTQMEQDRQMHGGHLTHVLNVYMNWVKTLSPHQRDQLTRAENPQARLALVRELLSRQREEIARRTMPTFGPDGDRGTEMAPFLDDKVRVAIFQELEKLAANRLTESQMEEVTSLQGIRRELKLLQLLKDAAKPAPAALIDQPPVEFAEIASRFSQFTENQRLRDFVVNDIRPPGPMGPRRESSEGRRLAILLMQSMSIELIKQQQAAEHNVDDQKLREFLETLPIEEQMELLSLDAADFHVDLKKQYLESHADLPRMSQISELFTGRPFWRRRFGDDRMGGGRPPRRGEGQGPERGEEMGPGPGRPPGPPRGPEEGPPRQPPPPFGAPPFGVPPP